MSMFTKRPKRGEDDDDLLRFQEEYLKSKTGSDSKPAAKVARATRPGDEGAARSVVMNDKVSLVDLEEEEKNKRSDFIGSRNVPDQPMEVTTSVLLERVVEKRNVSAFLRGFEAPQSATGAGFPVVPKLSEELLKSQSNSSIASQNKSPAKIKKKSLFMQQMEAKKKKTGPTKTLIKPVDDAKAETAAPDQNIRTDLSSMMSDISNENEQKIAAMTQEEIAAEQQQLAGMFDPGLIAMLRNRSKHPKTAAAPTDAPPAAPPAGADSGVSLSSTSQDTNQMDTSDKIESISNVSQDSVEPIKSEDLPFVRDDKWLNMDQLEHDKLRWLTPLDKGNQGNTDKKKDEKVSARFDFSGDLINPYTEDNISTHTGLHHHGEDPSSAGYTLEELYVLVRSLNTSQKVIALATIANIIRKAKSGDYQHVVNTPILKSLLEADIVLLLRYALDEKSDLVIAAAVNAWHSLLITQSDQRKLSSVGSSLYGHLVPELSPSDPAPPETEEEEIERGEEQYIELPLLRAIIETRTVIEEIAVFAAWADIKVLKRDVVGGLMMMDFLPRLRYILEVIRPQKIVCQQIFDILSRMVMTSSDVAYNITRTPRLISMVMTEFLPVTSLTESAFSEDVAHGRPLAEAMRFIRYLCASGRNMCKTLLTDHRCMDRILSYVSSQSSESDHKELIVESLLTWRTIMLYGLALDSYNSTRCSLITRLQQEKNTHIKSSIICLLSSFVSAAVSGGSNKPSVSFSDEATSEFTQSILSWTEVAGLIDSVYSIALRAIEDIIDSYVEQYAEYDFSILISSVDFLVLYLTHARTQPLHIETSVTPQTLLSEISQLICKLLNSTCFSKLISNIRKHSILLSEFGFLTTESSPSLPDLNTTCKTSPPSAESMMDSASEDSPSHYATQQVLTLHSLVNLLSVCLRLDSAKILEVCQKFYHHTDIQTYIRRIASNKSTTNTTNYFSHMECNTLIDICRLSLHIPSSNTKDLHKLSLALVPNLTNSSLSKFYELMNEVVFSQEMFKSQMADRTGTDSDPVLTESVTALPSISNTYISLALPLGNTLQQARYIAERNTSKTSKMLTKHTTNDQLPDDWPFLPIMHLYQTSNSRIDTDPLPPDTGLLLRTTLQFIYLLEKCCPDVISSVKSHAKLARIMCCFLLDNDLFLEPEMQRLLAVLLQSYTRSVHRLDFSLPVPGLQSFSDLYDAFLEQYEAASFGNDVFSQYLLLPMLQRQPAKYRHSVWSEHPLTLRSIQLKPQQLEFSMDELLYPEETDSTVIMLMTRYLLSGTVTLRRNTVMYITALHHVNRYMFTADGSKEDIKLSLLKSAKNCTVQELCDHMIFYKEYNRNTESTDDVKKSSNGIICYAKLPQKRCDRLKLV